MAQSELKIAGMKLLIEGGAQFTADLNTAKTTSKMLTSELKLLEAGTTTAGKNGVEFLRTKTEALTAKLEQQEAQTKLTRIALEDASTKTEVDAKQVAKLEDAVTKSMIAEQKLKVELINVNEQFGKATDAALIHGTAQKEMGEKLEASGKKLNNAGDNLTKYITVPALAAAAALTAIVVSSLDSADKVQLASDKYGMSTDRIQELTYAGEGLDVEFDTMASSQSKLIKAMENAKDPTSKQAEEFKKLGVEAVDPLTGQLRDSNDVWGEVIDSLGKMPNETEASSTAMILLGKSALDLNPLIRAGSDELANLSEEAHKNGAVMSGESIAALDKFGDSVDMAKDSIKTAAGEIAVKMLPTLEKLLPIVQKDIVPAIGKFADGVGDLIVGFTEMDPIAQGIVTTLAGLAIVAGPVLEMVGTGITLYGTMTTAAGVHAIAMATATTATEGLTVAEGAATAASGGLMAVLGPLALIAGGVGLAAVAYNTLAADSKAATDAVIEQTDKMNESSAAYDGLITDANTSATATKTMTDRLYNLADQENKSNKQKAEMKGLVSSLNSAIPDLSLTYDEQTDSLSKNKEAVYDLVDAKLAEAKQNANASYAQKLFADQITQRDLYTTAVDRYNAANKALIDQNNSWGLKNPFEGMDLKAEFDASAEALTAVTTASDGTEASIKKLTEEWAAGTEATVPYVDSIMGTGAVIVDTNAAIVESNKLTAEETAAKLKEQEDALKENEDAIKQYYDDLQQSLKDHLAEMGGLEDEGIKRSELTAAKLKENRDQQVKDYQDWREGLKVVAELIPGDVLAELEKLGPEYDQIIDDLANMSPEEIAAWVESWRAPAAEAAKASSDEMGKVPEAVAGAIINMTAEFQKTALLESAAREAGRKATQAYLDGSNSVSTTGSKAGMPSYIPKYADGIHRVPYDQIALIHKDEAVIPAAENPYMAAVSLGGIATNRAMSSQASSTLSIDYEMLSKALAVDYDLLGKAVAESMRSVYTDSADGLVMEINDREFGRVVRRMIQ